MAGMVFCFCSLPFVSRHPYAHPYNGKVRTVKIVGPVLVIFQQFSYPLPSFLSVTQLLQGSSHKPLDVSDTAVQRATAALLSDTHLAEKFASSRWRALEDFMVRSCAVDP